MVAAEPDLLWNSTIFEPKIANGTLPLWRLNLTMSSGKTLSKWSMTFLRLSVVTTPAASQIGVRISFYGNLWPSFWEAACINISDAISR